MTLTYVHSGIDILSLSETSDCFKSDNLPNLNISENFVALEEEVV